MTQLQPTLPSNPPVQIDRILRSTSGNASFQSKENFVPASDPDQLTLDESSENEIEPESLVKPLPINRQSEFRHGLHSSIHARDRLALRNTRRAARRVRRTIAPRGQRLGPTGLPDHLYEATYKHKKTKQVITGIIRPIPEALSGAGVKRYQDYRKRARKDLGKDGKPVWTDVIEEAFQQVPPVLGKKHVQLHTAEGTKLLGRNELICLIILYLTGEKRKRKQVSSHKQVLRNFIASQDQMPYCDCSEDCRIASHVSIPATQPFNLIDSEWEETADPRTWKWDDERCMLVCMDLFAEGQNFAEQSRRHSWRDSIRNVQSLNGPYVSSLNCAVQKMDFSMLLYSRDSPHLEDRSVSHTFTTMQSDCGAQARLLEDVDAWRDYFPKFDTMMKDGSMSGCDVILLESSLQILTKRPKHAKSDLGINFVIDMQGESLHERYFVKNTFYTDRGQKKDSHWKPIRQESIDASKSRRMRLSEIPLNAEWWTKVFSNILNCRRQKEEGQNDIIAKIKEEPRDNYGTALALAEDEARKVLAQEDKNSGDYIQDMSVMQEILGYSIDENEEDSWQEERVAVFLWRFRRARQNEIATTTWRRLNQFRTAMDTENSLPTYTRSTNTLTSDPFGYQGNIFIDRTSDTISMSGKPFTGHTDWNQHWGELQSTGPANGDFYENDLGAISSEHYQEPCQAQNHPFAWSIPGNDYQDSGYGSQPSSLPSQFSTQRSLQSSHEEVPASEALSMRIKEYYEHRTDECNVDLVTHGYEGDESIQQGTQRFSFEALQERNSALEKMGDVLTTQSVMDPSLRDDFSGGHIRVDLRRPPHSFEHHTYDISHHDPASHFIAVSSSSQTRSGSSSLDFPGGFPQPQTQNAHYNVQLQTPIHYGIRTLHSSQTPPTGRNARSQENDEGFRAADNLVANLSRGSHAESAGHQQRHDSSDPQCRTTYEQQQPSSRNVTQGELTQTLNLPDILDVRHSQQADLEARLEPAYGNEDGRVLEYLPTVPQISHRSEVGNEARTIDHETLTLARTLEWHIADHVAHDVHPSLGENMPEHLTPDQNTIYAAAYNDMGNESQVTHNSSEAAECQIHSEPRGSQPGHHEDGIHTLESSGWNASAAAMTLMHPGLFQDISAGPGLSSRHYMQQEGQVLGELFPGDRTDSGLEHVGAEYGRHSDAGTEEMMGTDANIKIERGPCVTTAEDGMEIGD